MTALRKRMLEELQRRNYSPTTIRAYLHAVPVLSEQEAKEYEARLLLDGNRDRRGATAEADVAGAYNEF